MLKDDQGLTGGGGGEGVQKRTSKEGRNRGHPESVSFFLAALVLFWHRGEEERRGGEERRGEMAEGW